MSEQIDEILMDAEDRMDKAIVVAREDFATVRTGRANAGMFNKVVVDYYGTYTPINQMASIAIPEARLIVITPYDKSAFSAIEKALRDSDLGVNPSSDGAVIRISLPQLTEERRKEFIKVAKNKAEDARISVRNIRRHAKDLLDKLQKDGDAGEDDVRRAEKHLDEVTHKHVEHVDEILKHKEAELLEV
ncbi:MAG: ribosome recycling factor [Candidatus Nanopelagicales bacterium]|nr:ribosome recycling factor [Candidatus Nanopelagicales bacterium]